jgi:type IV secretory pathway protease TraF
MRKCIVGVCAICLIAAVSVGIAFAMDIGIQVSPNVIVLRSQTHALTIHTTIKMSAVASGTVVLNDAIAPTSTYADDRGYLVAKFDMDDVKGIVSAPTEILTLTGTTTDGETFQGSETVQVKDH